MSDDLISRKTLLDYIDVGHLRNSDEKCFSERNVVEMIKEQPTAFDKEKIIEKLRKWENESVDNRDWNHGDGLIDLCEIHEHHGARRAYKHAIEIVEKGESE